MRGIVFNFSFLFVPFFADGGGTGSATAATAAATTTAAAASGGGDGISHGQRRRTLPHGQPLKKKIIRLKKEEVISYVQVCDSPFPHPGIFLSCRFLKIIPPSRLKEGAAIP